MKRVLTIAVLTAAVCVAFAGVTFAAGTQDGSVVALHAKAHALKNYCLAPNAPLIACSQFTKTWPVGSSSDVYLIVAKAQQAPGVAGVSCGIMYNPAIGGGVDVYQTYLCADLEFTNAGAYGEWPRAGGGNRITWVSTTNCQRTLYGTEGVQAVAEAFYVYAYSPDMFSVTPNNNLVSGPELAVADCAASTTYLPLTGFGGAIGFGQPGYNPCTDMVPVEPATWGKIKSQF